MRCQGDIGGQATGSELLEDSARFQELSGARVVAPSGQAPPDVMENSELQELVVLQWQGAQAKEKARNYPGLYL